MKYVCSVCGYIYDEEKEGVPFSQLPDSWTCPLCKAPKAMFAPQAQEPQQKAAAAPAELHVESGELSAGAVSALLSNLARGCEKQYLDREAQLFQTLASYYKEADPAVPGADAEELSRRVAEDLKTNYPTLEAAAEAFRDRGALRAYTWGLKVTRMQEALLAQYQREGEAFLEGTDVWVCSVCGFIYVGEQPPELCPVCKVPAWKFERVEGGASA